MTDKLDGLKERVDNAKESLATKKAEHKLLTERLKGEFKVKTLDEARDKLEGKEDEREKKLKRKEQLFEKIEEMLDAYENEEYEEE